MERFVIACVLLAAACLAAMPGRAETPFPAPADAEGRNATISPAENHGAVITFQPAEWPNALWSAGAGRAWDWRGRAVLAFHAANPNGEPVSFSVRIDDDIRADGVHHCLTAAGRLEAGEAGDFFVDVARTDSKATMGMNAGPPLAGLTGMREVTASGSVDAAHIVAFQIFMHSPAKPLSLRIGGLRLVGAPDETNRYVGIVDQFGQYAVGHWPGKVDGIADLQKQRQAEDEDLKDHPALPGRDEYGGWAAGPKLDATGFFRTTERNGRWWLVTPSGHLFLSFGIDVMQMGDSTIVHPRDSLFAALPDAGDPLARHYGEDPHVLYGPYKSGKTFNFYAANLQRKYGEQYEMPWGTTAVARLKSWGFNTIGNWSDVVLESMGWAPYTATLSVEGSHARVSSGSDYWGRMHDPFDPAFASDAGTSFRDRASKLKDDPWCLGYFVDNELSWSGGDVEGGRYGLAYGTLASQAEQPAKKALLAQLKAKYGTVARFNSAWGTKLGSWDALQPPYHASKTPNDAQKADMSAFVYAFAREYFTVVRDTLRKYDPNHLYLGCRFAWHNPDAVRAASEIVDVVSFNAYQHRLDPKEWAFTAHLGKPCIIGEFHMGALDRGMFHPGLVAAPDQKARAAMFQDYISSVADNPAFVGAHWFEYVDEPLTGRSLDGENYNIGFVSVTDTPYPEMVAAARSVFSRIYTRRSE